MRSLLLVLLFAGTVLAETAHAQVFSTTAGHAAFTSSVPLHTFTGTSDNLVGRIDLDAGTMDFYLDLETLKTGIGKRDKDMRLTLETGDYPFAEFFGRLTTPFDPERTTPQSVTVTGTFTIHGVSREIEVPGTLQRTAEGMQVDAAWELKLEDYGIVPPRLLIVKVDDVQRLRISALLVPKGGS